MINVLIGPASSGKTDTLIARAAETVASGRRGIHLIVPSAHAAAVLRKRLNDTAADRFLQDSYAAVTTFPQLYRSILDKSGADYHWLSTVERDAVLRYVINQQAQAGKLRYFAETAELPGLVTSLGEWIDELWRSLITPPAFAHLAARRSDKDRDIAQVFTGYAAMLETLNAVDTERAGHAALSAIEKAREPRSWFSMIAVDGFDFLSATQVQMLSTCAARSVEVIVSLTYDEARAIHYWQRPTVARLRAAGASFTPFTTTPESRIQVAAAALMNEQFDAARIPGDSLDGIHILSAPDRAAEVRAAAREIKRLVIDDRIPLDEISLVCRSLSVYAPHIERIFGECAIPFALDTPLRVAENPAVIALMRLFALSGESFKRRACVEAWRSSYFDWTESGLDEQAVDLLDAISLAHNVTKGRDQWRAAIQPSAETEGRKRGVAEQDSFEGLNETDRAALYERLANRVEDWFAAATAMTRATRSEHFAWAMRLLERSRIDTQAAVGDTAARDELALQEFKKILAAVAHDPLIRRLVDQTNEHSDDEITWPAFVMEVERALSSISYDRSLSLHPCVVAQEAHRLRPRRYRIVFVLGLIESEFPARLTERSPYTLVERAELRQAGLDLTETITDAGADLLQFYKAMNCAIERLYLSIARTDVAGGELLPSYLIEEVQPFAAPTQRIMQAFSHEDHEMALTCSLDELAMRTARADRLSSEGKPSCGNAAHRFLANRLPSWRMTERGARMELQRMQAATNAYSGCINDPSLVAALKKQFGPSHLWSATQINDYGSCPFRFFARHALRLEASREPGEGFASHHLGLAYHRILEKLYLRLQEIKLLIRSHTAEKAIGEAARIAENVLQQMLDSGEVRRDSLWEFNKEEIKRRVGRLLRSEAAGNDVEPVRPVDCERKFGYDDTEALVIECSGGAAKFRGIVDRLDYREKNDDWIVVDYKTRRTPIPIRDAQEGRNLQLPLYAMAASRVIKKGERVGAAYYLHIHSRKRGSELKSGTEKKDNLEELIAHAERLIRVYVEQVRSGRFPVLPNGVTVCQTCDYNVICRIQSLRTFEDEQIRDESQF